MQIYLLRHAIAEPSRAGLRDADRALTPDGSDKLARVLKCAREAGVRPELILSSPFRRAMETARAAGEALSYRGKIVEIAALTPDASPQDTWDELRKRHDQSAILLASHEPLMSALASFLLDAPSLQIDMKKATMVRIDCERVGPTPSGMLKWMLTPALAGA